MCNKIGRCQQTSRSVSLLAPFMIFISLNVQAFEFESLDFQGFQKEILSERQIRFVDKTNPVHIIHVQVEKYDPVNLWQEKNLKKDIEGMFQTRKEIYKIMGFSDIDFYHYELKKTANKLPLLNIFGSYIKFKKKKVYFSESNIYFKKNFIQVKIINEAGKISAEEVEKILGQAKVSDLEVQ
jgi:hypothetical protein